MRLTAHSLASLLPTKQRVVDVLQAFTDTCGANININNISSTPVMPANPERPNSEVKVDTTVQCFGDVHSSLLSFSSSQEMKSTKQSIDIIDDPARATPDVFGSEYYSLQRPVLFKSNLNISSTMDAWKHVGTTEQFLKRYGHLIIKVHPALYLSTVSMNLYLNLKEVLQVTLLISYHRLGIYRTPMRTAMGKSHSSQFSTI